MTVEIISWSISTKVWDRTGIELATPGSAIRHASVARHVTDCATRPGKEEDKLFKYIHEARDENETRLAVLWIAQLFVMNSIVTFVQYIREISSDLVPHVTDS